MTHDRIVDTSFLFKSRGKDATPSLKDVVKATLGKTIQDGAHDSVTDAKVRKRGAFRSRAPLQAQAGRGGAGWGGEGL